MTEGLVDRIYEAAFVPEFWSETLGEIATRGGAASGEFQLITAGSDPRWQASELTREVMGDFMASGTWRQCPRPAVLMGLNHAGFLCDKDYMEAEVLARDPAYELLASIGLGWQVGTLIPMPTSEIVGVTFERWLSDGPPSQEDIAWFDRLRPHLARAGLIASRLLLERARETVSVLQSLGLPAAVTDARGRVRAANSLFEAMDRLFLPLAFGEVAIADGKANDLLRQAIDTLAYENAGAVRSIPVPATVERPPAVIHVLPLRRAAFDVFSGSEIIIVATAVAAGAGVPSAGILGALFDLSPSEARLAADLAAGTSMSAAAASNGIALKSARTYLERIFAKTGTHRQAELVALLKSVRPVGTPDP